MFLNRKDAGERLAIALEQYRDSGAIVLAIPRGGVEVGAVVAQHLGLDLDIVIVRKLGHPLNPEMAFGAIAEDGSIHYTRHARADIPVEKIQAVIARERHEIKRRANAYRAGRSLPVIKNRVAIIVDDGIATGATIFAAIKLCRAQKARRVVIALPVAPHAMLGELHFAADEVIVLEHPQHFMAVGQAYHQFFDLSDDEVLACLQESARVR